MRVVVYYCWWENFYCWHCRKTSTDNLCSTAACDYVTERLLPQSRSERCEVYLCRRAMRVRNNAIINKAKNKKSPWLDNITMKLFKYWGNILKDNLLAFLNHIWQSRRILKDWEVGLVFNVHKKGKANNCGNCRGITLLSTASKLYANILRNKWNKYPEEILGEEQCGFRTGRGCGDAIFTINQILEKRTKSTNLPSVHRLRESLW
jgi:hypothetical protein